MAVIALPLTLIYAQDSLLYFPVYISVSLQSSAVSSGMEEGQHGHPYEHRHHAAVGLHSALEDENQNQQHDEKKSVLKKVKAKAKKIKDKIAKHGHDHDEHDHENASTTDDDEDHQTDDEMLQDSTEVHAATAPAPESAGIRNLKQPVAHLERSTAMREHPLREQHFSRQVAGENLGGTLGGEKDIGDLAREEAIATDPNAPMTKHQPDDKLYGQPTHQAKVHDPTGTGSEEAAGATPIVDSFGKLHVRDEPEAEERPNRDVSAVEQVLPTGTHGQFSPELSAPTQFEDKTPTPTLSNDDNVEPETNQGSSYAEKLSSATSAIADRAKVMASKLGYGDKGGGTGCQEHRNSYGDKITSATSSITESAVAVKDAVASKLGYASTKETASEEGMKEMYDQAKKPPSTDESKSKGVRMKTYLVEKLKPGEEDRALSEMISDVLHMGKEDNNSANKCGNRGDKQVGKVTESEEVAGRLGTGGGGGDGGGTGKASSSVDMNDGKAVVDRVKGAVGSWFGMGGDAASDRSSAVGASTGDGGG